MLWGFNIGLGATLFGLLARIIATFPFAVTTIAAPARALGRAAIGYWPIALGGLFGAIGAWVDKWVVWLSPFGTQIENGLLHAPLYDSAMFVSYLVVVPAYAAFVIHLEVRFFRNYRLFYSSILEHATLAQIRAHGRRLRDETIASLSGITVPQLVVCALVAVLGAGYRRCARHAVSPGRHAPDGRDRGRVPVSVHHLLVAHALLRSPRGLPRLADDFPRAQRGS